MTQPIGSDSYPSQGRTDTSREAYRSLDRIRGAVRRRVFEALLRIHSFGPGGATADEIEVESGLGGNTVRPRLKELEADGFIYQGAQRRRTRTGRRAIVWELGRDPEIAR